MNGRILERPKFGKQLLYVRIGNAEIKIGHEKLGRAFAKRDCGASSRKFSRAKALEKIVLPSTVYVSLKKQIE